MSALKTEWVDSSKIGGADVRADLQTGWHIWCGGLFRNQEILDVGSGQGLSRDRMQAFGNRVTTQEVAPALPVDLSVPVHEIDSNRLDVVTCFDVLEHVVEDTSFVSDLTRIARRWV